MNNNPEQKDESVKNLKEINEKMTEILLNQQKMYPGYDFITAEQLALLLGESINTIYKRVQARQFPYYKPGGKALLFKVTEVTEWIRTGRKPSLDELKKKL